jgi:capsular polysaccharide biosynthesis protein
VDEQPYSVEHHIPAVPGRRHVLLKQTWDANYGHWIVDTLPKVALLQEFEDLDRCLFVLNDQADPTMRKVVEDSLGMFGISPEQLIYLDKASYEFERLVVLGTLTRHPVSKSRFAIEVLEGLARQLPSTVVPSPEPPARRLYVTRAGTSRRRLTNESEVVELLTAEGYQVIAPETMTVREQMAAFQAADHVIGVMGAALANLAFSPRGVSVLALATPAMKHDYFYDIVCLKAGRYRGLQGKATAQDQSLGSDFHIDLSDLRESLSWLHGQDSAGI